MVLTAASPRTVKYRQIHQKIKQLETMVKDKDGCLYTAVTCFKKGIQKLQPVSSQENAKFTKAIRIVNKLTYRDPGEHCESTCDSYEKKTPKEFLKSFANLMQMRDMENEKYSNLNNGGKTNTPANFSIAFASIAKFVMKKVQRSTNKKEAILVDKVPSNFEYHSTGRQEDSPPLPGPKGDLQFAFPHGFVPHQQCICIGLYSSAPKEKCEPKLAEANTWIILWVQRLEASITDLELLKDIDNNFLDFYTPNDKRECNQTTLACFLKELTVLEQDVEEKDKQHVINIKKNLEDFKDTGFSNPTCKKCESNEKKKFPEFHQEMTSFLQSLRTELV
ncbi:hypothetical protein DUI87_08568 [Hirundo rustica rustica]|uniref:Interleukin n=1 Tax=Hirundo rustica rustica TaxID=333673 RepID=A0A3M0KQ87_HIRRU|nr:hypothetical protein DUI87_08568 [Hirundo rustica rustica]